MQRALNIPELIAPAGNWESLVSALDNGADSVYFGARTLNMRAGARNFELSELPAVAEQIHSRNKRAYLTVNSLLMDGQLPAAHRLLDAAKAAGIDAVVAWDPGILMIAHNLGIPIHLSTQAGVANTQSYVWYARHGIKRIILSRECTLKDIASIVKNIQHLAVSCETEAFVHGAMCISISGRCFLSLDAHGASANKGACLQPCRREYTIISREKDARYRLGDNYLLSAQDLCTVDFLDELIRTGISGLKIEGRNRPAEYVARVTKIYRAAIDAFKEGSLNKELKRNLKAELSASYNRGLSCGFYFGPPHQKGSRGPANSHKKLFSGIVKKFYPRIGVAHVHIQDKGFRFGDTLLIMGKCTPASFVKIEEIQSNHIPVESAQKGMDVGIKIPFRTRPNDKVFLWVRKEP